MKGLLSIVSIAALAAGCAASPAHESTGEYLDDATITTKVKTELLTAKDLSSLEIRVQTRNGEVQLGGYAPSEAEKERAAQIASAVAGVKEVHNDIQVR